MLNSTVVSFLDNASFSSIIFTAFITATFIGLASIYLKHRLLEGQLTVLTNGMPVKPFSKIIPLIGDVQMFLDMDLYQDKHHPKYGKIFATYFLGEFYVVFQDPSLFDQVYYENAKNIKFEWTENINKMFERKGIINAVGEEHKKIRKMILNYVGIPSLNKLFPGFVQIFNKHINSWVERTKDGTFIDIFPEIANAVWEAISFVILGDDIPQEIVNELRQIMDTFGKGVFAAPVDLPFTTLGKSLAAGRRFREVLVQEFKRRQCMPDRGINRKDFLQTLINESCHDGYPEGFDINTAILMVWASLDSTKGGTIQVINTMIEHAKEWSKVRDDVQNAYGDEGILAPDVTYSRLCEEIPYLGACVKEVMRVNGFPKMGLRRVVNDFDVSLNGKKYTIPAGSKIYSSYSNFQKDEESVVFKDAASFIPERFLGTDAEDKISKFRSANVSFGLGDRQCPGSPIAKLEMEVIMALMSKFKWIRKERPRDWVMIPTLTPVNGYWVKAVPIHQQ